MSSCAVTRLIVANDSMNFFCRALSSTFCGAFPIRPNLAAFSATKVEDVLGEGVVLHSS